MKTLFSLIESPFPPDFPGLYQELGIVAERFSSARVYGWGNDYAGATVSNLDVTLRTLQAVAPRAKIIVVMQPGEAPNGIALGSSLAVTHLPSVQDDIDKASVSKNGAARTINFMLFIDEENKT